MSFVRAMMGIPLNVQLLSNDQLVLATAIVEADGGFYFGTINPRQMPSPIRELFEEYEELVNGQVLSLLDELEDRINAMGIVARFSDGQTVFLADLQIFPKAGKVSFKAAPKPARQGDHAFRV